MGVTTYYSVGGEIIGERSGGVRTDYLRDALGSVTATKRTDRSTISNTYRYKPYGERLAKTGVAADPRFQWVGTAGYRETAISHSKSYVRARHYGQEEGIWTTVDPFWPSVESYPYARSSPTSTIDPSGLYPVSCEEAAKCKQPSLSITMRVKKCEVKPHPTEPGVLLVTAFKFWDYKCTLFCPEPKCGSCTMIQTVKDKFVIQGVVQPYPGPGDWKRTGPCPGKITKSDAPGIHAGGRESDTDGPDKIRPLEAPDTLPVEYTATYKVVCACGKLEDVRTLSMKIRIYRDTKGKLQCTNS